MELEILTPVKKLFSDTVYGVQLPGIDGSFEVLDKHAPLVSALKAGNLKVLKDKSMKNVSNFSILTVPEAVQMDTNKSLRRSVIPTKEGSQGFTIKASL